MKSKLIVIASCCILLNSQFVINVALSLNQQDSSNVADSGLIDNASEKILSREKRELFTAILIAILTGAATSAATVGVQEFYRASAPDECAVTIVYRDIQSFGSALNMNFKSDYDDNWNYEKLTDIVSKSGVDRTKERVDGGYLKLIQIYPVGKFCIEAILFSCGSQLNHLNNERSVILDEPTIRNAWSRQGNERESLEFNSDKNCLWFSGEEDDHTSVGAIDVHAKAFTDCENADENCISQHIQVFN